MLHRLRFIGIAAAVTVFATPGHAQVPAHYPATPDTLWYESVNPWHMYWVAASGDTIGNPIAMGSFERHVWGGTDEAPTVVVLHHIPNSAVSKEDTFGLAPNGRVLSIRGPGNEAGGRWDLLMPLPRAAIPLEVGTTWSDSVVDRTETPQGANLYRMQRSLRVERVIDTLGTRVAEVISVGDLEFDMVMVVDSASMTYFTLDARGPSEERFLFDVVRGRPIEQSWSMHLTGMGTMPSRDGARDTVPNGLISRSTMRRIDPEIGRLAMRPLPPGDTSRTTGSADFLHTTLVTRESVESGFARVDGLVGTARLVHANGVPFRFDAIWTEPGDSVRIFRIEQRDGRLSGVADATIPAAAQHWGIADYAMEEMLVPMLLAMPADRQARPIAIYRPYPGHWEEGRAFVMPLEDVLLAGVATDEAEQPTYLVFTRFGQLLFVEHSTPGGARTRMPGDPVQRARVETLIRSLTQQ